MRRNLAQLPCVAGVAFRRLVAGGTLLDQGDTAAAADKIIVLVVGSMDKSHDAGIRPASVGGQREAPQAPF